MRQLVVGHGLIGSLLAQRLVARGDSVVVATRDGRAVPGAASATADASDAVALSAAAVGADTIFLVTNPPYDRWTEQWPPIFEAAIEAAAASGAALVVMGNLYSYGVPTGPMTETSPETTTEAKGLVRRDGWARVREATAQGRIRGVEVRASDYFGPGAGRNAHLGSDFLGPVLASKTARIIGDADATHSWSYVPDIVATLIAAADHDGHWGRVWHVPSGEPRTRTAIAAEVNSGWGSSGSIRPYPTAMLKAIGLVNGEIREIVASSYQFRTPFVIDSRETERLLGVSATAWAEALRTTVESVRAVG
ncbi:NAD-dependent epimerase/dehydratase family protein [Leifsonia sp. YIM 134122]|uniref:NAD-dependent epimerase/dehydratase family protein n=1 Tax=Leifsonia stereocauli TaxID=3134136 RepID=A0ABU9W323_9MICO